MAQLFTPIQFRDLKIRNRIFVSPMCQYSAVEGVPQPWHFTHLGTRAVGGAGLVIVEATGVSPEARITLGCTGLWDEEQVRAFKPIVSFIKSVGAATGIQLAHAGRKASTHTPWGGKGALSPTGGAWQTVAPSAISFDANYPMPAALDAAGMKKVNDDFARSAELARQAGFDVIELHMAHGYLMHQFLSPLANQRKDEFGGSLENRLRFPLQVAATVRKVWPSEKPLFVRISATDWVDGAWDLEQSIALCRELKKIGVDFIDASSGGQVPHAKIPVGPGFQVPFAQAIREKVQIPTGAVGMITEAMQAEQILADGRADAVLLARELLRNPYWPLQAAKILSHPVQWPVQYTRAQL